MNLDQQSEDEDMSEDGDDEFDDNASFASVDDLEGIFVQPTTSRPMALTFGFRRRTGPPPRTFKTR